MYWPGYSDNGPHSGPPSVSRRLQPGILRRLQRVLAGLCLWLLLMLPPVRSLLEPDMTLHMLVQLPLLALAGGAIASGLPRRARTWLLRWNLGGISGLLLASITMALWMLPIALDTALDQPGVSAVKFLSLPLLLGLPCALSWPHAGFIVRGVFLVESIATLFRTGWLYLAAPMRLCASYRLDEQQLAGQGLLAAGILILALAVGRLLWWPVTRPADRNRPADPGHRES